MSACQSKYRKTLNILVFPRELVLSTFPCFIRLTCGVNSVQKADSIYKHFKIYTSFLSDTRKQGLRDMLPFRYTHGDMKLLSGLLSGELNRGVGKPNQLEKKKKMYVPDANARYFSFISHI